MVQTNLRSGITSVRRIPSSRLLVVFERVQCSASTMATADGPLNGSSPLKAPVVEIIDLLSSDIESSEELKPEELSSDEDDAEDQWSLYEDALEGMLDGDPPDDCGCYRSSFTQSHMS